MKQRVLWLLLSCLMALTLVLASCGEAVVEEEEEEVVEEEEEVVEEEGEAVEEEEEVEMVEVTLTKVDGTVVRKMMEKPQYGGVFTQASSRQVLMFDDVPGSIHYGAPFQWTNEQLLFEDWAKGPEGTNETGMRYMIPPNWEHAAGLLAESWVVDDTSITYNIRKGVHFHDVYPTNGRELTSDDVKFSIERLWFTPGTYQYSAYPYIESIETPDKYTVVVNIESGYVGLIWLQVSMNMGGIVARDLIEHYGDGTDWKNACGTGAFVLKDFVDGSSATLEKNPNYWMKDPFFPENTLPYVDGIKHLIILDASTRIAAMRTGKIDLLGEFWSQVDWEDADSLMSTNPELKYAASLGGQGISMRIDKPELPFYDVKVRRALNLAVDQRAIVRDYYAGNAELYFIPFLPIPENSRFFTPLEEQSELVQELYDYNPDKAKQLLAEAGYPSGFTTSVICTETSVDLYSLVKDYWSKIDVELDLDVREQATYNSIISKRQHEELAPGAGSLSQPRLMISWVPDNRYNVCYIDDPYLNDAYAQIQGLFWDQKAQDVILTDAGIYAQEQVYTIPLAAPLSYTFWQPWVKGYSGELGSAYTIIQDHVRFIWIDQDLREGMQ